MCVRDRDRERARERKREKEREEREERERERKREGERERGRGRVSTQPTAAGRKETEHSASMRPRFLLSRLKDSVLTRPHSSIPPA